VDKPTVVDLGIDVDAVAWQRSVSQNNDGFEVAFVREWVLVRAVPQAPGGLVSVFSRREWKCFLDGAAKGEFDEAAQPH
jgi:hypothetical protein